MSARHNLSRDQFPEHTYQYEVEYAPTHEDMSAGRSKKTYVSVMEKNEAAANLTAAQMVWRHGIPTSTKRVG
jgi:hypothetical protein